MNTFLKYLSAAAIWFLGILLITTVTVRLHFPSFMTTVLTMAWAFYVWIDFVPRFSSWWETHIGRRL